MREISRRVPCSLRHVRVREQISTFHRKDRLDQNIVGTFGTNVVQKSIFALSGLTLHLIIVIELTRLPFKLDSWRG